MTGNRQLASKQKRKILYFEYRKLEIGVKIISGGLVLLLTLILALLIVDNYESFNIKYLKYITGDIIGYEDNTATLFQKDVFLSIALLLTILINASIFTWSKICISGAKSFFSWLYQSAVRIIKEAYSSNIKYFLLIPLISYIYFAATQPITHDEATTFNEYINCSFTKTIAGYTLPNNHILFSLIERFFVQLSFIDLLFRLRISVILTSIFTWIISFCFVKKFYSEKMGLIVSAIASMGLMVIQYSFLIRGYSLVLFFFVVCLYAVFYIVREKDNTKYWIVFVMANALGFYTMATFLYPSLMLNLFLLFRHRKIFTQLFYGIIIVVLVYLLYMPVLLGTGLESLTNNPFVSALISRRIILEYRLPEFITETLENLFGLSTYILLPLFALLIVFSLLKKDKEILLLWLLCLSPLIVILAQAVMPFSLTFVYYGFMFVFLAVVSLRNYLEKIPVKSLIIALLFIQTGLFAQYKINATSINKEGGEFAELIDPILEDGQSYYIGTGTELFFMVPNLKFEAARKQFDITLMCDTNKLIGADSIKGYNYIFIQANLDQTQKKKPVAVFHYPGFFWNPVNIYGKNY
ncbi:hypothetical protein [Viscerimonas tarda]